MVHYFMVECDLTWPIELSPARRNKEATLPDHSKERDQAEARFKKAQKANVKMPRRPGRTISPRLGLFEKRLQD